MSGTQYIFAVFCEREKRGKKKRGVKKEILGWV
jgi:hypothetical protein